MFDRPRFGVVGIHGFSRTHIAQLHALVERNECRLSAVVAHARELDEPYAAELEAAGVRLVADFDTLLAQTDVDIVTLPVGTPLHVPMAMQALDAGFPVYLEKPVTGSINDLRRLEQCVENTSQPLFVGYQDVYSPSVWNRKRRLLNGELGTLQRIVVSYAWPRTERYYHRNDWAGRVIAHGTVVLDSPANNACSHGLNLALFYAGNTMFQSATPTTVTAELYRAKRIESCDTASIRVTTVEGVEIVFNASHACEKPWGPCMRIECDAGAIVGDHWWDTWQIHHHDGRRYDSQTDHVNPFSAIMDALRGDTDVPVCTLAMASSQTVVVNGAHLSSPIHTLPPSMVATCTPEPDDVLVYAPIMNAALHQCHERGALLSELPDVPWATAGQPIDVSQRPSFTD